MGLELVKKAQALKFQGGNTPSTLVPGVVPKCKNIIFEYSFALFSIWFGGIVGYTINYIFSDKTNTCLFH